MVLVKCFLMYKKAKTLWRALAEKKIIVDIYQAPCISATSAGRNFSFPLLSTA